jgi:RNA polymerase sigma factor (sigma-70 family)
MTPPQGDLENDAHLAAAAATGDGAAFATLYGRYESRVYNICLRITGDPEDAADATQEAFLSVLRRLREGERPVRSFPAYLFTSARHAAANVAERRNRTTPAGEAPEPAPSPSAPRDLTSDPEGAALLAGLQESVRAANTSLPERQREVLALRELGELSYDEIASAMDLNRNAVSQLIWRARIGLRDAMRASAVASIVATSQDCERALPLIAAVDDGEHAEPGDRAWLDGHLAGCVRCRLGQDALVEAGASYRAWLPVAPAAALGPAVISSAGGLVGADWSGPASAFREGAQGAARGSWTARGLSAAAVGAAIVAGLLALTDGPEPDPPAATPGQAQAAAQPPPEQRARGRSAPAVAASPTVAGYSSVDSTVLGVLASDGSAASGSEDGATGGGGLPFTGLDLGWLGAAGLALVLAGAVMRRLARPSRVSP